MIIAIIILLAKITHNTVYAYKALCVSVCMLAYNLGMGRALDSTVALGHPGMVFGKKI